MRTRTLAAAALAAFGLLAGTRAGEAHKPITSPYTYEEDVRPILRDHCGACHMSGGVAPMSLLEYEESVPWAESMRLELVAGHMPPWRVARAPSRFLNVHPLTARELNVLLTWAVGGTPRGTAVSPDPVGGLPRWPLGPPDLVLQPEAAYTMAADVEDHVETFLLELPPPAPRWIQAVDVMPGTPAIVRRATVSVVTADAERSAADAPGIERLLSLWLPGDAPHPVRDGAAFLLPAGARLALRIHYRKTWQHERETMRDRSQVGIYLAEAPAQAVRAVALAPSGSDVTAARRSATLTFTRRLQEHADLIAIYPDPSLRDADVTVHATRPDGSREELIAFRPLPNWARRYWYREPVSLPGGTAIEVRVSFDEASRLLPPGALPRDPIDPSSAGLTLNVVPASSNERRNR